MLEDITPINWLMFNGSTMLFPVIAVSTQSYGIHKPGSRELFWLDRRRNGELYTILPKAPIGRDGDR